MATQNTSRPSVIGIVIMCCQPLLYFVFTKLKDMGDCEISLGKTNMFGQFKIKKEVVLGLLKSI